MRALSEPLLDESPEGSEVPKASHAERVAAAAKARRDLGGRLWCAGVILRLLTLLNGLALVGAVGYYVWLNGGVAWLQDESVDLALRGRTAVTWALPMLCGLGLLALEWNSACHEKAARRSVGCAFGACGRFALLLLCALVMAPLIHLEHARLELYATAGVTAFTALDALLQAWLLSCVPAFRSECVADFKPDAALVVDSTAFPQVYQRDEGAHLHLGVLLPGFATREACSMTANCSQLQLVGEVMQLDSPFAPVDEANSSAGPFGPFGREVRLAHPIDVSTPVESRVGHGIFEFRFLKGYLPSGIGASSS